MALEELLALITGGLQGESKRRADNASRQRYQQEQAFKQWQVMSDLDNKRAQVEQMKAYHDGMLKLGETKATNQNDWYDAQAARWPLDRQSRMEIAGLNAGARLLPYAQTPGAFDVAGKFMGLPGGSAGPGDFVAPSVVNNRYSVNQRDESQALERINGAPDRFTATKYWEAENMRRKARGLEPLPPGFAQPNARSASSMLNAGANDRNIRFNTTGPMAAARIGTEQARGPFFKAQTNYLNFGQTPLAKERALSEPVRRQAMRAVTEVNFARSKSIPFNDKLRKLEVEIKDRAQKFYQNINSPDAERNLTLMLGRAEQMRRGASIYQQRANGAFYSAPGVRITDPSTGQPIEDYRKLPEDRKKYYLSQQELARTSRDTADSISGIVESMRKSRNARGVIPSPGVTPNYLGAPQGPLGDIGAPRGYFPPGSMMEDGNMVGPDGGLLTPEEYQQEYGDLDYGAGVPDSGPPPYKPPVPQPVAKPTTPPQGNGKTLPKPGAVGAQARAAGSKAGLKPQPIMKSDAAKRAGVGVKARTPKNPRLEMGFSAITDALKGSSVNPNAGKRPR